MGGCRQTEREREREFLEQWSKSIICSEPVSKLVMDLKLSAIEKSVNPYECL